MINTIKHFLMSEQTFTVVLLVLIAVTAYGLGLRAGELRLPVDLGATQSAIIFTHAPETYVDPSAPPVVASKAGTRYHYEDCPGVATIQEANLIRFTSADLAQAAGYTLASNCDVR